MRYQLSFNLSNEKFPLDYRRIIMSYIKKSLSDYDEETFKKYYNEKDPIIKPFTFSVYFKSPQFTKEKIIIENKSLEVNISIADYSLAILLYNSINHKRYKPFPIEENVMTLKDIAMLPEKQITTNEIKVKFISPLVVRERVDRKDWYYSYSEEGKFKEILKLNLKEQLPISQIPTETLESFDIEAIDAKKTIIKFYEKKIEASLGTYILKGNKDLLTFIYQCGLRKQA